jgi:lysophospholipase L1-like esterase
MKSSFPLWKTVLLTACMLVPGCCQAPNPAPLYVCFGDSITAGKDVPTYPETLDGLIDPSVAGQVANEGESGESADNGADRIKNLFGSCNAYPNTVALLYLEGGAGLIDWIQEKDSFLLFDPLAPGYPYQAELTERLGNIKNNILAAVQTARSSGLQVYMATYYDLLAGVSPCDLHPLKLPLNEVQAERANHYTALLNQKIGEAASETGSALVDLNGVLGPLQGNPENFFDCNHPSASGNALIAEVFFEALTGP